MARIVLTYYLDVLSSWCLIAEDALARIKVDFGDAIRYEWQIAALRDAFGYTPEQLRWYYERTKSITGVALNASWLISTADGSPWPNLAAEAARGLGCEDDRVRLALARAAMIDGQRSCDREVAVRIAADAGGIGVEALEAAMNDQRTRARIAAATSAFKQYHVDLRPTFVVSNAAGDVSVLSGCWRYEPIAQALRAQLDDQAGYDAFGMRGAPAGVV